MTSSTAMGHRGDPVDDSNKCLHLSWRPPSSNLHESRVAGLRPRGAGPGDSVLVEPVESSFCLIRAAGVVNRFARMHIVPAIVPNWPYAKTSLNLFALVNNPRDDVAFERRLTRRRAELAKRRSTGSTSTPIAWACRSWTQPATRSR